VPVVAAVRGLALGGGCEFQMHSAKTVAHLESYIGLVEAGVGLLPAGGGLKEIAERGYRPPLPARRVRVAGDVGIATFRMLLVNMLEGRFISDYDNEIATRIATVLCGGEIDRGAVVDEDWLLKLERKHFVELAQQPKTQERIAHMLKSGKPLRN
jgi:hypothetical protein